MDRHQARFELIMLILFLGVSALGIIFWRTSARERKRAKRDLALLSLAEKTALETKLGELRAAQKSDLIETRDGRIFYVDFVEAGGKNLPLVFYHTRPFSTIRVCRKIGSILDIRDILTIHRKGCSFYAESALKFLAQR